MNFLELVCRVPIYWGCVIEGMWSMLQEFGVTCACGAVYTKHWKQLLKEFGAACVCVVLYTLSIGKTYVAQDSAEAALSAHLLSVVR